MNSAPGVVNVGVAVGVAWRTSLETILPSIPVPWTPYVCVCVCVCVHVCVRACMCVCVNKMTTRTLT